MFNVCRDLHMSVGLGQAMYHKHSVKTGPWYLHAHQLLILSVLAGLAH